MNTSFLPRRSFLHHAFALIVFTWQVCGALPAAAQLTNFQVIHAFGLLDPAGHRPKGPIVPGSNGDLFGVTYAGGASGYGGLYRLSSDGRFYNALRQFGAELGDGRYPTALVAGLDGQVHGVTARGGGGHGTLFGLASDGAGYAVSHAFGGNQSEASFPVWLLRGMDGKFYGVSTFGGQDGYGTVFRLNADGTGYETLHWFDQAMGSQLPKDGLWPYHLMQGSDGALYGTTQLGGTNAYQIGTIFTLQPDGSGYRLLHSFDTSNLVPAEYPTMVEGADGLLYGTTNGKLFRLGKDGTGYTVLRQFGGAGENSDPKAGLLEAPDGRLYGTTRSPRTALYRINKDGTGYEVLWQAAGLAGDVSLPLAPLILGQDRALLGTTSTGGEFGEGTVYRFGHALQMNREPAGVRLEMTGVPGWSYELQRSSDLSVWTTLAMVVIPAASGAALSYLDAVAPAAAAFYRMRAP
jgi:uncharacterized repeat protein (TIGR03803 family)